MKKHKFWAFATLFCMLMTMYTGKGKLSRIKEQKEERNEYMELEPCRAFRWWDAFRN